MIVPIEEFTYWYDVGKCHIGSKGLMEYIKELNFSLNESWEGIPKKLGKLPKSLS